MYAVRSSGRHDLSPLWRPEGAACVPGVGQEICAMCCGTKRLVEIRCPSTCGYLQAARAHPGGGRTATTRTRCRRDRPDHAGSDRAAAAAVLPAARGRPRARRDDPLRPLLDADVADAASALAATYETSARGVIYEHQAQSLPAQRLVADLQAALAEIGRDGRTRLVEREAPHALRAIERGVRAVGTAGRGPHGVPRTGGAGARRGSRSRREPAG